MAVEAQAQEHFITSQVPFRSKNADPDELLEQSGQRPVQTPPFNHHYLHDLESLWWIAIWAIFTTKPESDEEYILCESFDKIFPSQVDSMGERMSFFTSKQMFMHHTRKLHSTFQPIVQLLNTLRQVLVESYQDFNQYLKTQQEFPIDMVLFAYRMAIKTFDWIAAKIDTTETLVPALRYRLTKRKREMDDEGSRSSQTGTDE